MRWLGHSTGRRPREVDRGLGREYCCGKMKILVIGSGGREHALVWKLAQSPSVTKLWCAPGNGGISRDTECFPVDVASPVAIAELAQRLSADLTLIGPELPLVNGVADEFAARGLKIFGPTRAAAQLEGSKIFAKQFMQRHRIPTARVLGEVDNIGEGRKLLQRLAFPVVLKADGLCAGKGVLVASGIEEASGFLERSLVRNEFGDGGARISIEEALAGPELSVIIATDGRTVVPMAPSRDHKRLLDGDRGPNTGGMGAYSTDELLPAELRTQVIDSIVFNTLKGLQTDGIPYCGFLYFGLMLTAAGPKVLEFNCRSGDPETQAIVMRMDFDLAKLLDACVTSSLERVAGECRWKPGASICTVVAAAGYPGSVSKGSEITGLRAEANSDESTVVFHAGTAREGSRYYTSGGRVLGVCAEGRTLESAASRVYDRISRISFSGMQYRSDIGRRLPQSVEV